MKATAIVPPRVLNSNIKQWVESRIDVEWVDVSSPDCDYVRRIRESPNVIAWNCRMPHWWMRQNGHNILFLDNSLIAQRAGIFVDSGGMFSNSNLCVEQIWRKNLPYNLDFFAQKHFKRSAFAGGNPNGPILVALQNRTDCNIIQQFPLAENEDDKVVATLKLLYKHLPKGREIIIRPHPLEKERFTDGGVWRSDWSLFSKGTFQEAATASSALVTVNSTCASEAVLLGVPVATLGKGAFSGSGATLDCSYDPSLLLNLFDYKPDTSAGVRYCSAVLGNNFIPYDVQNKRSCNEFERWVQNNKPCFFSNHR